jgi:2-succinyl-5-enolpyruvyl-6-hydroxy-3-cyclohexene-1-carboxylate synthase
VNPSTALATVLVDELVRGGVREAVLCPGSRSAPLAYALQEAERAGRLRLHVRVDERSAGFLALGLAKGGGGVVPVVTTSGTAVANLHPAVLEAHHAGVALLPITADRPPELRGTGANQTTDQVGIFGGAVRWSHDLGAPERRAGQNAVWRSVVARARAAAVGGLNELGAGPVHLNVPLREPLVPDPAVVEADSGWPESLAGRPDGRAWVSYRVPSGHNSHFAAGARTLVVIGDLPQPWMAAEAAAVAARVGWPAVAEPFGASCDGDEGSVLPRGPLLLTATEWVDAHAPDHVVVVGRVTLSRAVAAVIRRAGVELHVVTTRDQWSDPSAQAAHVWTWSHFHQLDPALQEHDPQWLTEWTQAGKCVDEAARAVLADDAAWPSGLALAETLLASLPDRALLFLGSSNPVRDLDLAVSPGHGNHDLEVLANRGLAGIDGCVSTAVGIALARGAAPTEGATPEGDPADAGAAAAPGGRSAYALMGDLTFLHDTNGLLIGPDEPRPDLTIVVTNDDGGGIFTTLEPGDPSRVADFERIFGTPTGTSLADLCRAHGVGHILAETRDELSDAVSERSDGLRVVEVPVPRESHRRMHSRVRAAALQALRGS